MIYTITGDEVELQSADHVESELPAAHAGQGHLGRGDARSWGSGHDAIERHGAGRCRCEVRSHIVRRHGHHGDRDDFMRGLAEELNWALAPLSHELRILV